MLRLMFCSNFLKARLELAFCFLGLMRFFISFSLGQAREKGQVPGKGRHGGLPLPGGMVNYLPCQVAGRLLMKASMPSFWSSVLKSM